MGKKMFQVSTLQALALGYFESVISVGELLQHGDTGLGTFKNVDGEMVVLDGKCYRADHTGHIVPASDDMGVPFAAVSDIGGGYEYDIGQTDNIEKLKELLTVKIEEDFGLNSMHIVRIDGDFERIDARSESAFYNRYVGHTELKEALSKTQKDFHFENVSGSMVCVYFPDYMDGINAAGWHLHFASSDRKLGGHVFGLKMTSGKATIRKISNIEMSLPTSAAFDTYALKSASQNDIKEVEQGKQ